MGLQKIQNGESSLGEKHGKQPTGLKFAPKICLDDDYDDEDDDDDDDDDDDENDDEQ